MGFLSDDSIPENVFQVPTGARKRSASGDLTLTSVQNLGTMKTPLSALNPNKYQAIRKSKKKAE